MYGVEYVVVDHGFDIDHDRWRKDFSGNFFQDRSRFARLSCSQAASNRPEKHHAATTPSLGQGKSLEKKKDKW